MDSLPTERTISPKASNGGQCAAPAGEHSGPPARFAVSACRTSEARKSQAFRVNGLKSFGMKGTKVRRWDACLS